jgi:hypothetical protein
MRMPEEASAISLTYILTIRHNGGFSQKPLTVRSFNDDVSIASLACRLSPRGRCQKHARRRTPMPSGKPGDQNALRTHPDSSGPTQRPWGRLLKQNLSNRANRRQLAAPPPTPRRSGRSRGGRTLCTCADCRQPADRAAPSPPEPWRQNPMHLCGPSPAHRTARHAAPSPPEPWRQNPMHLCGPSSARRTARHAAPSPPEPWRQNPIHLCGPSAASRAVTAGAMAAEPHAPARTVANRRTAGHAAPALSQPWRQNPCTCADHRPPAEPPPTLRRPGRSRGDRTPCTCSHRRQPAAPPITQRRHRRSRGGRTPRTCANRRPPAAPPTRQH